MAVSSSFVIAKMEAYGVPEYFDGEVVFITGGTGFMGKVLIEKLLRSCPGVKGICLLMRPKKGMNLQQRLDKMYSLPFFDRLKKEQPDAFETKLKAIAGDVMELGLGLSAEDRSYLVDNVSFVYHSAASVRFDQPLKSAIILNTRGTREVCALSLELKKVKVVMHVSTLYCQSDKKHIEEKIYPAPADWRKAIAIAESLDKYELEKVMPIYMAGFPNTYTFTKALGESVVHEMLDGSVPNIIFRPSIVISTSEEPMPGWNENFNGPVGLIVGCTTGLIRAQLGNSRADYVPVDCAIKSMITATWHKGTKTNAAERNRTVVYNCSSYGQYDVKFSDLLTHALAVGWKHPPHNAVWYPSVTFISNPTAYYLYCLLFHMLPGLFLDGFLKIFKFKPMVMRLMRKHFIATNALQFFLMNEWIVNNDGFLAVNDDLQTKDKSQFEVRLSEINVESYISNAITGGSKYLLKQDDKNDGMAMIKYKILYGLDIIVKMAFFGIVLYLAWSRFSATSFDNYSKSKVFRLS